MKVESLDDARKALDVFNSRLWMVEHNNGAATILLDAIEEFIPSAVAIAMEIQAAREYIAVLEGELDAFRRAPNPEGAASKREDHHVNERTELHPRNAWGQRSLDQAHTEGRYHSGEGSPHLA